MQKKPFVNPHQFNQFQRREGMRQLCLLTLEKLGGRGTAREVAADLKKSLKHIWPRFTELAAAGKIRDTKFRAHGKGRPQVIWATPSAAPVNDQAVLGFDEPEISQAGADDVPEWFKRFGV